MNKHDLYELAVQSPAMEAAFLRAAHGADPLILSDEFCGAAAIARAWALYSPRHHAFAVDRDAAPLAQARLRMSEHPDSVARIKLIEADVREVHDQADVLAAFNFALCEFHERAALVSYLRHARSRLRGRGVFAADLYGGSDAFVPGETHVEIETPDGDILYTWEQREANPLTARVTNAIHFRLPDGSELQEAFRYDWRLWSPAELADALHEAGFASIEIYDRYGDAMDERGDLLIEPLDLSDPHTADALDDPFVVYLVARTDEPRLKGAIAHRS